MASEIDENFSDFDAESNPLVEQFNNAADHVKNLVNSLAEKQLLLLYGCYKQATTGKCTTARPRWYEMQAKSKWDAWNALGCMSQEEAMQKYVNLVQEFDPNWEPMQRSKSGGDNWAIVSSLLPSDAYMEDDDKTLIDFVKDGNLEKVQTMLEIFAKDNCRLSEQLNDLDDNGLALIHWAADRGNIEMLRCLLSFGADVNCVDSSGQTALHYAASCSHLECVRLLLSTRGIKVSVKDEDGCLASDVCTDKCITDLLFCAISSDGSI